MTPPSGDASLPTLRKPSKTYVDNYIARRGEPTPARTITSPNATAEQNRAARHMPRIFYALERECPKQYYPEMHVVSPRTLRTVRGALLVMCALQIVLALAMVYLVSATHVLHDAMRELFTEAVAVLCAFAACAGFFGVCASSRSMLLFFYISQLWSLANVSTFAVLNLMSADQSDAACLLYRSGELTRAQLADRGLDCDDLARTSLYMGSGVVLLIAQLWLSCFLSKLYAEMLQDKENDEQDHALVNFVWQRRGETWVKLEKFEDVVQRQFEELRASLVAHAHNAAKQIEGPRAAATIATTLTTPPPASQATRPSS